ncbi:N-succinylarginine dihydrolase [Marinobacterium mangrovicola]|uniref:N-succinylarginine dihydrolase n=1 Tax=Marinobacterium mangrovicola TaxID=1476959 RepID=A0A4R1GJE4_9GAMM|nr:N-succinylarginine dihydrolase [Marinobacterium mangrovicola]TCK08404.1 succinylarginine dihydrolase [Marinobacterium mangrovicola]
MTAREANFDGLVGPTHNYAGLSLGNIASEKHRGLVSHPKEAALQGLAKMKRLTELGLLQGVIPPQERPDLATLRRLGFHGSDARVLTDAAQQAPFLLHNCASASAMWSANAATVSPSADTLDGRVHFTPANLISKLHRSLETDTTASLLRAIFPGNDHFAHHAPLPPHPIFGDEGAANHNRLCREYGDSAIELFVYGRASGAALTPQHFPARQTLEACQAINRKHQLKEGCALYAQQNPQVIDQGVFHNDVIAVCDRNLLFCHERAFVDQQALYDKLKHRLGDEFKCIEVPDTEVSVTDAVSSYLFNSQLLSLPDNSSLLLAPTESRDNPKVHSYLQQLEGREIDQIEFCDLRQSMANGGGPACLRLRVVLTEGELANVNPAVLMDERLYASLRDWVERYYPEQLMPADLADPVLLTTGREALDSLTQLLGLSSIYPFQRN